MKKIIHMAKKLTFAFLLLYTYNLVASSYNLIIPINCFTLAIITILDAPGLVLLVSILKLFYWG